MTLMPGRDVDRASPAPSGETRLWRVGPLTYTAGGLFFLFLWLLGGDFALNVRDRAIPPVMQVMFKKFDASDMVTGMVFSSIPAAVGMIVAPIVAYRSDRLRSRWGRRIPFMIGPAPLIVLATVGLGFAPQLGGWLSHGTGSAILSQNAWSLVVMSVCWTLFEVGCMTTYAVWGAFLADVVPQSVIGLFFGLYRAIGLLAGIAFFGQIFGHVQTHFTAIFLSIGAIYGVSFTVMCLKVKEAPAPPGVVPRGPQPGIFDAVQTYFREGFGDTYYLWLFAALILGAHCTSSFNLFAIYYSESLGVSDSDYGKCISTSYFISLFLSIPIGLAADRYHPLRLSMALLALYGVVMAGAGCLVRDSHGFELALVAHTVISGSLFTAWASLTQRLLPRSNFAVISSACGILGSITGIFFAPIVGRFLDLVHHEYSYTFVINAELTLATLIAFYAVHRRFMILGGPRNYVAPEKPASSALN